MAVIFHERLPYLWSRTPTHGNKQKGGFPSRYEESNPDLPLTRQLLLTTELYRLNRLESTSLTPVPCTVKDTAMQAKNKPRLHEGNRGFKLKYF